MRTEAGSSWHDNKTTAFGSLLLGARFNSKAIERENDLSFLLEQHAFRFPGRGGQEETVAVHDNVRTCT